MPGHVAVANLVARYAELLDSGDYDGVGALFAHATIRTDEFGLAVAGYDETRDFYATWTQRYADTGTLKRPASSSTSRNRFDVTCLVCTGHRRSAGDRDVGPRLAAPWACTNRSPDRALVEPPFRHGPRRRHEPARRLPQPE
ncbi:MAG: nuclear transport factor 2 family protein [Actinobacteria bacterium]|nr:nuclear transport factor 2 family protein [Actinomycetota bacterium]